jgi:hypothetical protein
MNITPKNILRGRNSDGSTFTIEEWDFATLANLQFASLFVMLIFLMAIASIASPILAVLAIISFSGKFNLMNLLSIIFGVYFIYDCSQGWMSVLALSLFAKESVINFILQLNIVSIIISSFLLIFGGLIRYLIVRPVEKYDVSVFNSLPVGEQRRAIDQFQSNKTWFNGILALLIIITFKISSVFIPKESGWVKRNYEYVSPEEKEEARQDSIKKSLGDFKTKEERDAYFDKMERRYGN